MWNNGVDWEKARQDWQKRREEIETIELHLHDLLLDLDYEIGIGWRKPIWTIYEIVSLKWGREDVAVCKPLFPSGDEQVEFPIEFTLERWAKEMRYKYLEAERTGKIQKIGSGVDGDVWAYVE